MNLAVSLLRLRQGNGAIEDYVVEFLELSNQVDFNEVALKDIFRVGLNEPIRSGLPGGKINFSLAEYIDYALLICGSSFTVGVVEEEHDTSSKAAQLMPAKPQPAHVTPSMPEPFTPRLLPQGLLSSRPPPQGLLSSRPPLQGLLSSRLPLQGLLSSRRLPLQGLLTLSTPEPVHVTPSSPEPAHAGPLLCLLRHGPMLQAHLCPMLQVLFPFTGLALHPAPWTMSVPPPLHHPPGLFGFCFCFVWASGAALRGGKCKVCFGFCFMFLFFMSFILKLVMVLICVLLPFPSCLHAIGSPVQCVMF